MLERSISVLFLLVAAIHLLPVLGFLSAARVSSLYAVAIADPNLEILLRHRAVLFGLLGVSVAYAAFHPAYQMAALVAASVSAGTFLMVACGVGGYNTAIARVVTADWLAVGCLLTALALRLWARP